MNKIPKNKAQWPATITNSWRELMLGEFKTSEEGKESQK